MNAFDASSASQKLLGKLQVLKIHRNQNNLTISLIIQHTEYIQSGAILVEYGKILC